MTAHAEPERQRPDPATVALQRREIAARYKARARARRTGGMPFLMRVRRRELEKLFRARHGDILPDNAIGRDLLFVLLQTTAPAALASSGSNPAAAIMARARQWAPWLSHDDAAALADRVLARPLRWTADVLAKRLGLSDAERTALGITTIGACDVDKAARLARRRERNRVAKANRRRALGVRPRSASLTCTRPWDALGMSRASWYRAGKPASPAAHPRGFREPSRNARAPRETVRRIRVQHTFLGSMVVPRSSQPGRVEAGRPLPTPTPRALWRAASLSSALWRATHRTIATPHGREAATSAGTIRPLAARGP